jgi:hypothetical protein
MERQSKAGWSIGSITDAILAREGQGMKAILAPSFLQQNPSPMWDSHPHLQLSRHLFIAKGGKCFTSSLQNVSNQGNLRSFCDGRASISETTSVGAAFLRVVKTLGQLEGETLDTLSTRSDLRTKKDLHVNNDISHARCV